MGSARALNFDLSTDSAFLAVLVNPGHKPRFSSCLRTKVMPEIWAKVGKILKRNYLLREKNNWAIQLVA
jgi:hypothetical protein